MKDVTVSLDQAIYVASEDNGSLEVCVNLFGELERAVTVQLFTDYGYGNQSEFGDIFILATPDEDFLTLSTNLTFVEEGMMCSNISIFEDFTFENVELFSVLLASDDPAFIADISKAEVHLLDSDGMMHGLYMY